jgi:hypothetical protein
MSHNSYMYASMHARTCTYVLVLARKVGIKFKYAKDHVRFWGRSDGWASTNYFAIFAFPNLSYILSLICLNENRKYSSNLLKNSQTNETKLRRLWYIWYWYWLDWIQDTKIWASNSPCGQTSVSIRGTLLFLRILLLLTWAWGLAFPIFIFGCSSSFKSMMSEEDSDKDPVSTFG